VSDKPPLITRFRRFILGNRTGTVTSSLAAAARLGPGDLVPDAGPFDSPPEEPIVLDPETLPWELREDWSGPDDRTEP
jgi:hypothetical protein